MREMTLQADPPTSMQPKLATRQLIDISFGLLGVQIVWGLQNAHTTRIFQRLGASVTDLPILWIAAPITGLLVQPLIGHLSDHTRGKWGRRRPYLVFGAASSAAVLVIMVSATSLWMAVAALWILTAAVNVAMQPLRALMADLVPPGQRTKGFSVQVVFIGMGAVFASALPWMLTHWAGLGSEGTGVSRVIQVTYIIGAATLLLSVGWTMTTVSETPLRSPAERADEQNDLTSRVAKPFSSAAWMLAGIALAGTAAPAHLRREVYLIAVLSVAYGAARQMAIAARVRGRKATGLLGIVDDILMMPRIMQRLAVVQFFTWFALFTIWVYAVPAIANHHFAASSPASPNYEAAANWVGILFAAYDAVAIAVAIVLPTLVRLLGLRYVHALCLSLGAMGVIAIGMVDNARMLLIPAVGVGCAWASILSTPYTIIANVAPPSKVGVYMGIHNIFLVLPQLVAAASLGLVLDRIFNGHTMGMLAVAAGSLILAAFVTLIWLPIPVEPKGR